MRPAHVLILLGVIALGGCGTFSAPKSDTFYRLPAGATAAGSAIDDTAPVVYVPLFTASDVHAGRALVFAHDDGVALEQYTYHYWADSPRVMLQQALVAHLTNAGVGRMALEPAANVAYTINARIQKFERRSAGKHGTAEVVLEFDVVAGDAVVAEFSRSYARAVVLGDDAVATCAVALGQSAQEILAEFARDLRAHWSK